MIISPYFGNPHRNRNFGNQLFELASLVGLARRYDTSLHLPHWRFAPYFAMSSFVQWGNIPESYISLKEKRFACCLDFFDELKELIQKEVVFVDGYLQSESYWKDVEEEVRVFFSFEDQIINSARSYLQSMQINPEMFVAISVRRGDFETDPYHYLLPIEYYLGAKDKYFPKHNMMIFSDDIGWCKDHFLTDHVKVFFAENKTPIEQLALMSLFQKFIIANSTFSWWGAYLANCHNKIVIRPYHHFDGVLKLKESINDHYPQEWIEYNYEIEHSFPNENLRTMNHTLPVYAINLKHRIDRYSNIVKQFEDKPEYHLTIVPAIEHEKGAFGLWKTVQQIVFEAAKSDLDFFILCEDDHTFTDQYTYQRLSDSISQAESLGADLLSGGYSWFDHAVQISEHLFWARIFNGMQFTVIFKRFYAPILNANFGEEVITDVFLSNITDKKFVIYPYISTQKEFGYSDVTNKNNESGYVDSIFTASKNRLAILNKVAKHYGIRDFSQKEVVYDEMSGIFIPTYIINLKERSDRLAHALKQFEGKPEFEVRITEACRHEIGAVGLWESIVQVVENVIQGEDDVIIICEDDHVFTEHYHKNNLFHHIIEAANQGAELLSGGIGGFGNAFSVAPNRYWVDWIWCTQFIVLYRPIFQKILDYEFKETDTADGVFSELTSRKMVIYPFVSIQHDFGYSDVTRSNDEIRGKIAQHFKDANAQMAIYHDINQKMSDWSTSRSSKADAEKLK